MLCQGYRLLYYFLRSRALRRFSRSLMSVKVIARFRIAEAARILVEGEPSNKLACKVATELAAAA